MARAVVMVVFLQGRFGPGPGLGSDGHADFRMCAQEKGQEDRGALTCSSAKISQEHECSINGRDRELKDASTSLTTWRALRNIARFRLGHRDRKERSARLHVFTG